MNLYKQTCTISLLAINASLYRKICGRVVQLELAFSCDLSPASHRSSGSSHPSWSMHVSRLKRFRSRVALWHACCAGRSTITVFFATSYHSHASGARARNRKNVYVFPDLSENRHGDAPSITAQLGMPPSTCTCSEMHRHGAWWLSVEHQRYIISATAQIGGYLGKSGLRCAQGQLVIIAPGCDCASGGRGGSASCN